MRLFHRAGIPSDVLQLLPGRGETVGLFQLEGRGMVWFAAGLVAGPLAGLASVVGRSLVDQTGLESLGPALTGGAAFTALLVMATAAIGMGIGNVLPQPDGSRQPNESR